MGSTTCFIPATILTTLVITWEWQEAEEYWVRTKGWSEECCALTQPVTATIQTASLLAQVSGGIVCHCVRNVYICPMLCYRSWFYCQVPWRRLVRLPRLAKWSDRQKSRSCSQPRQTLLGQERMAIYRLPITVCQKQSWTRLVEFNIRIMHIRWKFSF